MRTIRCQNALLKTNEKLLCRDAGSSLTQSIVRGLAEYLRVGRRPQLPGMLHLIGPANG